MPKIGVILSGCGVNDGAEIHESVLTMLALEEAGAEYVCMAPDVNQMHVVNHLTGQVTGEARNVLVESARIARGDIRNLAEVNVADYDGFMFPGGFGAAKNLCTFAVDGADCSVDKEVARVVREAHATGKPIAFVCIAPVIAAKVLGNDSPAKLTIGNDEGVGNAINTMGGKHVACPVREAVIDNDQKIISSPAYMLAGSITEVNASVKSAVSELLTMVGMTSAAV